MNVVEKTKMINTKTSHSKVLIVDDEISIRVSLREFLRDADYEVSVAQDADEAMGILAAKDFDVVVTDIIMPRITGVKLLKAIKEASPHVEVILMTGEPTVKTASEAVRAGAYDYLTKPIGKEAILKIVSSAARVKALDDERRRLLEANRLYQKNLEQLVEERTEALIEKTAFLDSILRSSMDLAIAATDTDFRITYYNPAAERLYGKSASEVIGKTVMEIHTKENVELERFEKALETVMKEGEYCYEIIRKKEDGKHYLDSRLSGIYDENETLIGYLSTASDITKRKRAEEELHELVVEMTNIEDRERKKFSEMLHEGIGQNLAAVKLAIMGKMKTLHLGKAEGFDRIISIIDDTISSTRAMTADLYPTILDDMGFEDSLEWYSKSVMEPNGIEVILNFSDDVGKIIEETKRHLFHLCRESFHNIMKYASASRVVVDCRMEGSVMRLSIKDDGVGFSIDAVKRKSKRGFGQMLMREWVKSLGGELSIKSAPGEGVEVMVIVPARDREDSFV